MNTMSESETRDLEERLQRELEQVVRRLPPDLSAQELAEVERQVRQELAGEIPAKLQARLEERARLRQGLPPAMARAEPEEEFLRFSLCWRLQHMVLFSSCILLILTGLPLKFPDSHWAAIFFRLTGGVTASGIMHRVGAVGLIGMGLFHLGYIMFTREGNREFLALLPRPKDVLDLFRNVSYFLGRSRKGARFGRFSYVEKFDYWAVYWGMVVMIGSGAMLWFQDFALRLVPKYALDMAHEAHSDEALLATLAIIVWHFYNVHFNPENFPISWTWLNGKISREKMIKHHPLEYQQIMAERSAREGSSGEPLSD